MGRTNQGPDRKHAKNETSHSKGSGSKKPASGGGPQAGQKQKANIKDPRSVYGAVPPPAGLYTAPDSIHKPADARQRNGPSTSQPSSQPSVNSCAITSQPSVSSGERPQQPVRNNRNFESNRQHSGPPPWQWAPFQGVRVFGNGAEKVQYEADIERNLWKVSFLPSSVSNRGVS